MRVDGNRGLYMVLYMDYNDLYMVYNGLCIYIYLLLGGFNLPL